MDRYLTCEIGTEIRCAFPVRSGASAFVSFSITKVKAAFVTYVRVLQADLVIEFPQEIRFIDEERLLATACSEIFECLQFSNSQPSSRIRTAADCEPFNFLSAPSLVAQSQAGKGFRPQKD